MLIADLPSLPSAVAVHNEDMRRNALRLLRPTLEPTASIPLLLGACLAALFGYLKELQTLLISGGLLAAVWFMFSLMSYSLLAGTVFVFFGLISFKMLQYRHTASKE